MHSDARRLREEHLSQHRRVEPADRGIQPLDGGRRHVGGAVPIKDQRAASHEPAELVGHVAEVPQLTHCVSSSKRYLIAVDTDRPGEVLTGGYAAAGPGSTTFGTATGSTPGRTKGAATPANGTAGATGAAKGTAGATGAATGAAGATGATGTARAAGAAPAGCTAAGAGTLKVTPLVRSSRSKAEPLKSRAPRIASCTVFLLLPSSYVPSIRRAAHSSRVGSSHRNTRMSSSRAAGQAYATGAALPFADVSSTVGGQVRGQLGSLELN